MQYSKADQIGKRLKPKQSVRNSITKKEYDKAYEVWGGSCFCGRTNNLEMHHIFYRSKANGRGVWRNLILLCEEHHRQAHKDQEFRRNLEIQQRRTWGKHYHLDKWDLWELGLIEEPTEELMEEYFKGQRE